MTGDRALITAASFPVPDLIKKTANPAEWDQLERFAPFQAKAANQAVEQLDRLLDEAPSPSARAEKFSVVFDDLAGWRYAMSAREEGRRPRTSRNDYLELVDDVGLVIDNFTPGLRSEGSRVQRDDPEAGWTIVAGPPTPASRLTEWLAALAGQRFAAEAPGDDVLQNQVGLPDGRVVNGNRLLRGLELAVALRDHPVQGAIGTTTGTAEDRAILRQAAFESLTALDTQAGRQPGGRAAFRADPAARQVFADAAYMLYQAPKFVRGNDATTRVFLAAAHVRIFEAAPILPHDIDVMAYVAGQPAFREHVEQNLRIAASPAAPGPAADRPRPRAMGSGRGEQVRGLD